MQSIPLAGDYTALRDVRDRNTGQPERPVDAAVRELREETGLACKPGDLRYMGTMRGKHKSGKAIDGTVRVPDPVAGFRCEPAPRGEAACDGQREVCE